MWAGSLIPLTAVIVLVAESEEQVDEATTRLARVGIENVKGYLAGGIFGVGSGRDLRSRCRCRRSRLMN